MATIEGTQKTVQTKKVRSRPSLWQAETIGQKLTLGFLVILILLTTSGVVAYVELVTVGNYTKRMEIASMQAMDASHLERLSETVILPIQNYILTGDPMAKAQFDKSTNDLGAIVTELGGNVPAMQTSSSTTGDMGGATTTDMTTGASNSGATTTDSSMAGMPSSSQSIPLPSGQQGLLTNFIELWTNVHGKAENIFTIPNPVGNQDAINQLKDIEASSQSMAAFAQSIHTVQMDNVSQSQIQANAIIVKTSLFLIIAVVVAFLLGAFLSRMIGRAISRPVAQLTQISNNISLGDLDTKVDVKGGGEIGELAGAIERMRTSLRIIIDRLSDEEEDLRSWAGQLASHELRRKVRGGIITLGGHKYTVGKDLDGQYVYVKLDYDLREIVLTPPSGEIKHLSLSV